MQNLYLFFNAYISSKLQNYAYVVSHGLLSKKNKCMFVEISYFMQNALYEG